MLVRALGNIYRKKFNINTEIEPLLYGTVSGIFHQAADEGFQPRTVDDPDHDFYEQLRHSGDVFSAFKVHRAQNDMAAHLLDSNGVLKPFNQWLKEVMPIASHQCGAWLKTEYDTAVIRAHQAADWQQFRREADVLPNLRWMPSTSAHPGEDHRRYWGTVRPIDDDFWNHHRPGDRWNCKCSLSNTDDPAMPIPADNPEHHSGGNNPQSGLKGNPGTTAQIFSDDHPYFPDSCKHCPFYTPTISDRLRYTFQNRKKHCNTCQYVNKRIEKIAYDKKELIKKRREEYRRLLKDDSYTAVKFDKKTGGLSANHIGHITHDGPRAERFFGRLTSTDLENECQMQLFRMGHSAILMDESRKSRGNYLPALDLRLDDTIMDIRSVTGKGWYSNIFVKKNDQLRRFNKREDITDKSDSLCLYFHDPKLFNEEKMEKSLNFFRFYRGQDGNLIKRELKHIYCVIKGRKDILIYHME